MFQLPCPRRLQIPQNSRLCRAQGAYCCGAADHLAGIPGGEELLSLAEHLVADDRWMQSARGGKNGEDGFVASDEMMEQIRALRRQGRSPKQIARVLGLTPAAVAPLVRAVAAKGGACSPTSALALWNLYWRGSAAMRERIESELDPGEEQRRERAAAEPANPGLVLYEVREFAELARAGAYIAGEPPGVAEGADSLAGDVPAAGR